MLRSAYEAKELRRPDYSAALRKLEKREKRARKDKARREQRRKEEEEAEAAFLAAAAEAEREARRREEEAKKRKAILTMPFESLPDYVEETLAGLEGAFSMVLTSAVVKGVSREFRFSNMHHFKNWVASVQKGEVKSDSENYRTLADVLGIDENVFSRVSVALSVVEAGCNHHKKEYVQRSTPFYSLELFNPIDVRNNCGFKVLEYLTKVKLDYATIRQELGIAPNTQLTTDQLATVYRRYCNPTKHLIVLDDTTNETLKLNSFNYVYIEKGHYYAVVMGEYKGFKDRKTKRGMLYWDIETRKGDDYVMVGETKSYLLRDAILCIYYKRFGSDTFSNLTFRSGVKSSCRQFLDWLTMESNDGHFFHCVAHNGSRFDNYFLLSTMSEQEQLLTETQLRGYSIIGMQYKSHLFKDSCCFLTASLESLCNAFKVKEGKLVSFEYLGQTLTNKNICFYKPELSFDAFMRLQYDEPEFWTLYEDYCLRDCIGLGQVWGSFKEQYDGLMNIVFKYKPALKARVDLMGTNTIGSLSKKILEASCLVPNDKGKFNKSPALVKYEQFLSTDKEIDPEKVQFITNGKPPGEPTPPKNGGFKRGGISHSNQPGKHTHALISYDIASQYPASLMHMTIPAGKSDWVYTYSPLYHGFYHLQDLEFSTPYVFKPVANLTDTGVLDWGTNTIKEIYLDSEMLKYLKKHYGLTSFKVVRGLVSECRVKGKDLFGAYVSTLYDEKKRQDALKSSGVAEYNPALRECIKLFLNSLTGKLVEDPSRYFKLHYTLNGDQTHVLNGVETQKVRDGEKWNTWVAAGCMVYSYSKRLLFEYVRCLPDNSNDVIHIETDSLYFNKKFQKTFVENVEAYKQGSGDYYPVSIGSELGNVKVEKDTTATSYFLGKKFYCIGDLYKIKGIPLSTIDEHGNDVELVNTQLYQDVFDGKTVKVDFQTMKKALFAERTFISSHTMSRTINPKKGYKLYE